MAHLLVLFQRELRTNFTFILMIGISICDIFYVSTFVIDGLFSVMYDTCESYPYDRVLLEFVIGPPTREMTRKSSSVFSFSMALFRTCSVTFPTSGKLSTISKPKWAIALIIGMLIVLSLWEFRDYAGCKLIRDVDDL